MLNIAPNLYNRFLVAQLGSRLDAETCRRLFVQAGQGYVSVFDPVFWFPANERNRKRHVDEPERISGD